MTPVSRKLLEGKVERFLDNILLNILTKQTSPQDSYRLLKVILTPTEIQMIKKRIGIIMLLNENIYEENIAKITKTTRQTVSRIRLQLLEKKPNDRKYIYSVIKRVKLSQEIKDIIKTVLSIDISYSTARKKLSPFHH